MEIDCKQITQMPTEIPTAPLSFTGLTIFVNMKDDNSFRQRKKNSAN